METSNHEIKKMWKSEHRRSAKRDPKFGLGMVSLILKNRLQK